MNDIEHSSDEMMIRVACRREIHLREGLAFHPRRFDPRDLTLNVNLWESKKPRGRRIYHIVPVPPPEHLKGRVLAGAVRF